MRCNWCDKTQEVRRVLDVLLCVYCRVSWLRTGLIPPTEEDDSQVEIQRILDEGKAQGPRDGGFIPDHPILSADPPTEED